ncbi:hypothetical protein [Amycolatopsis sp. w19]|uniref:hypothetical protein n=1 Tax=Amycolatopsis sp. w19 TaxID=3448134 RepID=UPI003F1DB7E9
MKAAEQAERDADEARQAAARADQYAKDADSAARNAEKYADNIEARAKNAEEDAKAIQAQLAQLQEELRKADEEQDRREAEEAINEDSEVPALTPDEENDLRAEKGQAGVDEYNRARTEANKDLLGLIVAEGGQVILDLVGFTDAKRCFMEGDFISCVMTVINALPILKIARFISKIPDAISTTVRIVKGIRTFKDVKLAARRVIDNLRDLLKQLKGCKSKAGLHAAAACTVVDKQKVREKELEAHRGQPSVAAKPGERHRDPVPRGQPVRRENGRERRRRHVGPAPGQGRLGHLRGPRAIPQRHGRHAGVDLHRGDLLERSELLR